MNVKEKILLVQLLLEDIRGNWGWENAGGFCDRAEAARDLCEEIAKELKDDNFYILSGTCSEYISYSEDEGNYDGRFFRDVFPQGYEHMDVLHGLTTTFIDKSEDFKLVAKQYLTYPEHRFDDWEDYIKG